MSGLLNKLITTGAQQELGTIPGTGYSMINILAVNPNENEGVLQIWLSSDNTPSTVDLVESGVTIPGAGGSYEMVGRIVSAGEKIYVQGPVGMIVRAESIQEQ